MFGPAGVEEHGIGTSRLPRNLGRPVLSATHVRTGTRITNPRPAGYACWTGGSEAQAYAAVPPSEPKGSEAGRGQGIGVPHTTNESGEPNPRGPGGGKGAPCHGTVGGKHGRCIGTGSHVHATTTASGAGEASPADGVHLAQPPPGPRLAGRGLSPDAQGCCPGRGRADRRGVQQGPVGEPARAARSGQVRPVPGAAGAAGAHPERDGE